jgi:hypothetical protein
VGIEEEEVEITQQKRDEVGDFMHSQSLKGIGIGNPFGGALSQ